MIEGKKITPKQLRERYGGISAMTLWRWSRNAGLGLPQPLVINSRKYYDLAEIESWERARAAAASKEAVQ